MFMTSFEFPIRVHMIIIKMCVLPKNTFLTRQKTSFLKTTQVKEYIFHIKKDNDSFIDVYTCTLNNQNSNNTDLHL